MKKAVHIVTFITFLAALYTFFFLNLIKTPDEYSASERRRLAQFPEFSPKTVLNGKFMEGFDDYAVDQAAGREPFRRLKANFDLNVLRKMDNNRIFVRDGTVFKTEYPLNESSVLRLTGILNTLYDRHLAGMESVYYTVVPDKNAYLQNSGHLILDYTRMKELIRDDLHDDIKYIDIFEALSLDSYYRTDSHWKQPYLDGVAEALGQSMGFKPLPMADKALSVESFDQFYGVYYGQSALNIEPDELVWTETEATRKAIVTSMEKPGQRFPVYDRAQLDAVDPYNIFMCGPAAVVTAQNPMNPSGRSLIIFRDSYASALSPLLLDAYSTITLIDLRYVFPDQIGQFIDFTDQDVLFIYSATLFNSSDSIRAPSSETFISPFIARGRIG